MTQKCESSCGCWARNRVIVVTEARLDQVRRIARRVLKEPFAKRSWSELLFFALSVLLAALRSTPKSSPSCSGRPAGPTLF